MEGLAGKCQCATADSFTVRIRHSLGADCRLSFKKLRVRGSSKASGSVFFQQNRESGFREQKPETLMRKRFQAKRSLCENYAAGACARTNEGDE